MTGSPPRESRSSDGLTRRHLRREELDLVWTIDRSEVIERTYSLQHGELVLRADPFDMRGWPPGEAEHGRPWLDASFDRGARFIGIFDADRLVAVGVLDTVFIGAQRDLLQLSFLHVGRDQRGRGLGVELFDEMAREARTLGAKGLYVSATPSEHTIDFYRHRGCRVIDVPDPDLYAREPEDIHLECRFDAPDAATDETDGPRG